MQKGKGDPTPAHKDEDDTSEKRDIIHPPFRPPNTNQRHTS
jgi:hypothetical protein